MASPGTARRILGIDPGLTSTGYGIVAYASGALTYVTSGCIKSGTGELPGRLKVILDDLAEVIDAHRPDEAAIEQVFVNANPYSTLMLGQARGAAICAAVQAGLPVTEYRAQQVKLAVVGNGQAEKRQVKDMVRRLLALPRAPAEDAADALACAICHAHGGEGVGALRAAGYRVRRGRIV